MRLGVHLPLADFGEGVPAPGDLNAYTRAARDLGFATVAANDHLVWRRSWLDGPTALAAVAADAGDLTLATTVTLPVVRHPVTVAKSLSTLAILANGPVVGGLGPGSTRADFDVVGVDFEERWQRFDESLRIVRALVRGEDPGPTRIYPPTAPISPVADPPPAIWFGSWGSDRRLAAMAALADGWLASAYNASPDRYADARARLDGHLSAAGRVPAEFPDAIVTAWLFVSDDKEQTRSVLEDVLAPTLNRDPETLTNLPIGSPDHCRQALAAYAAAGARELVVWPLREPIRQIERVAALRTP